MADKREREREREIVVGEEKEYKGSRGKEMGIGRPYLIGGCVEFNGGIKCGLHNN